MMQVLSFQSYLHGPMKAWDSHSGGIHPAMPQVGKSSRITCARACLLQYAFVLIFERIFAQAMMEIPGSHGTSLQAPSKGWTVRKSTSPVHFSFPSI